MHLSTDISTTNKDQADYWNGDAGQKWVNFADRLDMMLQPFGQAALKYCGISQASKVIDIGCGAGALSMAAGDQGAQVIGIDVSEPLISLARQRSSSLKNVSFKIADATVIQLDHQADRVISRFGVMFFQDPVMSFRNIKNQTQEGGSLSFVCWQALTENPWAGLPLQAALPYFASPPPQPVPRTPGPFAFSDPNYIHQILSEAEWKKIVINSFGSDLTIPGSNAAQAARFIMELGPVSRLLKEQDIDLGPATEDLTRLLEAHSFNDGTVQMPAKAWCVTATA